jgi:hypothetical protein
MPDAEGRHHRWLFAYEGSEKPPDAIPVVTGSDLERDIFGAMDAFLATSKGEDQGIERLRELVQYLKIREPCLPHDLRRAGFIE